MRLSKEIHTKVVHPKMMLVGFYLPVRLGVRVSELCIKIHGVGKSIPVQLEGSEFQKEKEKNTWVYKKLPVRLSKELHIKVVHPKMMLVGFSLPVRLGVRVSEWCIKTHG